MRSISLLVLAGLVALSYGFTLPYTASDRTADIDTDFAYKQRAILELVQHVHQNEVLTKRYEESKLFKFEDHYNFYTNVEAVREFVTYYKHGLLPMNELFTIHDEYHRNQTIALFHVFYYAKDFETFLKSAVWARFHCNEGMFIYALTVSLRYRFDTLGIELPAPYEIYPYYFFNSETIQVAQNQKMQGFYGLKRVQDVYTVIIPSNYTDYDYYTNTESRLAYFTEDIGLNSYYYYFHVEHPFWMKAKDYSMHRERRGESFFYFHQQLLARYYLERLSNGYGKIPEFSFRERVRTGYHPSLRYYNGVFFPSRDNDYNIQVESNFDDLVTIDDFERRIRDAITSGYIYMPDGTRFDITSPESIEYFGNLIQGNADSLNRRYYGDFISRGNMLLGRSMGDYDTFRYNRKVMPSVLEHYETALRDPITWQFSKYYMKFFYTFKDKLPSYNKMELMCEGVTIKSVEMDKLVTYFDKYDSDITNCVDVELYDKQTVEKTSPLFTYGRLAQFRGEDFVVKARQSRMNYMPFTVKLNLHAESAIKTTVRMFLGPKYNEFGHVYGINENRENWVLLDMFKYDLVAGENLIIRNSHKFNWYVKDRTTYFDLYKATMMYENGKSKWELTDYTEERFGMPQRFMLPKGNRGGMPFQFFFIVTPYMPSTNPYYFDALPFGYPFDRKIDEVNFYTENMFSLDVNIFHKKEIEVNTVHKDVY